MNMHRFETRLSLFENHERKTKSPVIIYHVKSRDFHCFNIFIIHQLLNINLLNQTQL